MFITFLTVLAAIWVVLYLLGIALALYQFTKLSSYQQSRATNNIEPIGTAAFIVSVAWLITRIFV